MRFAVGLLACLGASALTSVLADPPTEAAPAATATQAAPAAPAPAATPDAAAAQAAAAKEAAAKAALDKDTQHFLALGYKPEMRHGEQLYCRRETALGSRLTPVKTCGTIGELKATEQRTRNDLEQAQQRQTSSPQGPGPMGGH
jgi:outer membrane receptor protein involved in Fe transport